jgi:hypothetical protein
MAWITKIQAYVPIRPTSTMDKGEASALLKVADSAMPVVTTAQFVVLSRRGRQTVLR